MDWDISKIGSILGADEYKLNEPMSLHTSFKIGGEASIFIKTGSDEKVRKLIRYCKDNKKPYTVIGRGSNLLVSDNGYDGMIIAMDGDSKDIAVSDNFIEAAAGASLFAIAREAHKNSLTGFEFAAGIPGSLGGAVVMNAGAYGGEIKDVLDSIKALDADGNIKYIKADKLDLSYRHSNIEENELVILAAKLKLKKGDATLIKNIMDSNLKSRMEKQPLDYPSAGSTFKRPEGFFAAKLIEDCGLKGYKVGGGQVSTKHAGFVINTGSATASDIYNITEDIIRIVKEKTGVMLEREIKLIGDF